MGYAGRKEGYAWGPSFGITFRASPGAADMNAKFSGKKTTLHP